jgi:hypothetical protein
MKLIPNWKRAWRMATVRIAMLAVGWGLLPPESQAAMLDAIGVPAERIPAVLGAMFLVFRLIDQPKVRADE